MCLVKILRHQGLTGLKSLSVCYSCVIGANSEDEALSSPLAAAALQHCPALTVLKVVDVADNNTPYHPKPFDLLPLATAMHRRGGAGASAAPLHTLSFKYWGTFSSEHCLKEILVSETCASLMRLELEAGLQADSDIILPAVAGYLRHTGAPSLRRLCLVSSFAVASENV